MIVARADAGAAGGRGRRGGGGAGRGFREEHRGREDAPEAGHVTRRKSSAVAPTNVSRSTGAALHSARIARVAAGPR